jgi:quercetin dioxygenase-like cupin family protein
MSGPACSRTTILCVAASLLAGLSGPNVASAQGPGSAVASCDSIKGYQLLDFWVGEWDVYVGSTLAGRNRIEKILNGCAVAEHWSGTAGGEGRSTFFFDPATSAWSQVWLTDRAAAPGGFKQKKLTQVYDDGGVRFQGTITPVGGASYLDRTTLSPQPGGRVLQLIEVSGDSGATWRATFRGEYRRRAAQQAQPAYQRSSMGTRWLESDAGLSIKVLVESSVLGSADVEVAEITFPAGPQPPRPHMHGATEIIYVLSGELDHVVNGASHRLTAGMVGIVRPGHNVIHRVLGTTPVKALILWAPGGEVERLARAFRQRPIRQ